jgi:hypothetical protein
VRAIRGGPGPPLRRWSTGDRQGSGRSSATVKTPDIQRRSSARLTTARPHCTRTRDGSFMSA